MPTFAPGGILHAIPLLLFCQKVRRFKIDAVQRVEIKNDLLARIIVFPLSMIASVGYAAVREQELLVALLRVDFCFRLDPVDEFPFFNRA